ncbi:MAG: GIY-YIG nuclease family protein, partial [Patescibacteria group bacterium]|nr:GIY-YIG nuclease family protein [Patescibacteria group bacterium]
FYTGLTKDLKRRLRQHNSGEVKFTKNLRPLKLVHYEKFINKLDAAEREQQIKNWTRIKKNKFNKIRTSD